MPLPLDSGVFWPKTIAEIPAGLSRVTDFYGKYLQHAATAGTNGGAATHAHTADTHTHTQVAHRHNLSMSGAPSATVNPASIGSNAYATGDHTHVDGETEPATGTNQNTVVTINAATADPPYYELILLKPNGTSSPIPQDAIAFSDRELAGFRFCDGTGGAPDLDGLFIKIANDDDAGATGGAATHTHTSPAHTHTQNSHIHADSLFGDASALGNFVGSGTKGQTLNKVAAHHTARSIAATTPTNQDATVTVDAASSLPAYIDLLAVQAANDIEPPVGIILPFFASVVPDGWQAYDAGNRQPRCIIDPGSVGATGGANTHTHTTEEHTHIQDAHNHTYTLSNSTYITRLSTIGTVAAVGAHTHTGGNSMGTTAATNNDATVTMSTDDIRLPYRTVLFIMKNPEDDYIIKFRRKNRR